MIPGSAQPTRPKPLRFPGGVLLITLLLALGLLSCSPGSLWGRTPGVALKRNSFDDTETLQATNYMLAIEQEPSAVALDLFWQPDKPENIRLMVEQRDSFRKIVGASKLELSCGDTIVTLRLHCQTMHSQTDYEGDLKTKRFATLCVQDFDLKEFHTSVSPILACSGPSPFRLHGDETGLFHSKARGIWNDTLIDIHQRKDAPHDSL